MQEDDFSLADLLRMLEDDRDKYNIRVDVSAGYTRRFILAHRDMSVLDVIREDVRDEILESMRQFRDGLKLFMLSSEGMFDMTDELKSFSELYAEQKEKPRPDE